MSSQAGLWIDHRQAFVVHLAAGKTTSEVISSNLDRQIRATRGSRSSTPYGPQDVIAEDREDRKLKRHLEQYYAKVAQSVRDAESIFIIGPGEAKVEFSKYLEKPKRKLHPVTIQVEPADRMTEVQIIERVKKHYLH